MDRDSQEIVEPASKIFLEMNPFGAEDESDSESSRKVCIEMTSLEKEQSCDTQYEEQPKETSERYRQEDTLLRKVKLALAALAVVLLISLLILTAVAISGLADGLYVNTYADNNVTTNSTDYFIHTHCVFGNPNGTRCNTTIIQ